MCGIFGFSNISAERLEYGKKALAQLAHRGPDGSGEWYDNDCYIGHRRLSILDLSEAGAQPMVSPDKKIIVTCNGEIYNFLELRKELEKQFEFKGHSDTEVILHGYRAWGIETLIEKLDGMFAFTVYDQDKKVIHLVRDRVGIKPLYWSNFENQIAWASELKSLETFHGNQKLNIDKTAIFDYYNYLYIPSPKTVYQGIYKLRPGHHLTFNLSNQKVIDRKYWALEDDLKAASKEFLSQSFFTVLEESIKSHLQSDVPVGVFLSGGLDSSIVAYTTDLISESKLDAFTIDIPGSEQDQKLSRLMAQKLNLDHHTSPLTEASLKTLKGSIKTLFDEPFADTSCFPMLQVSKLARSKGIKVVLSGDGGDELFYGYRWYDNAKDGFFRPHWHKKMIKDLLATKGERFLQSASLNPLIRYMEGLGAPNHALRNKLARELGIPKNYDIAWFLRLHDRPDLPQEKRWRWLDFHTYLPEDILTKVDRTTMAAGIEARVPLLDRKVITYAFSLNPKQLNIEAGLKTFIKTTYQSVLPEDVIHQAKKGFSIPVKQWNTYGEGLPKQIGIFKEEFSHFKL